MTSQGCPIISVSGWEPWSTTSWTLLHAYHYWGEKTKNLGRKKNQWNESAVHPKRSGRISLSISLRQWFRVCWTDDCNTIRYHFTTSRYFIRLYSESCCKLFTSITMQERITYHVDIWNIWSPPPFTAHQTIAEKIRCHIRYYVIQITETDQLSLSFMDRMMNHFRTFKTFVSFCDIHVTHHSCILPCKTISHGSSFKMSIQSELY